MTRFLLNKELSARPIELAETPKLTQNFAGIGTRNITKEGVEAIRNVYSNTFNQWTEYGERIMTKYPDLNEEEWNKLTNEQKEYYIKCL